MFTTDSLDPNQVLQGRIRLHEELVDILGTSGEQESRVYFDPPASVRMKYPAIRYKRDGGSVLRANDRKYIGHQQYSVTVIDPDPDSTIAAKILERFPYCSLGPSYTADNLHHDILTLFY